MLKQSIQDSAKRTDFTFGPSVSLFGCDYPIVDDFESNAGVASGHYYHQDLLVANKIFRARPDVHLDIGSRIDGFVSHLLAFEQKIIIGDIRPVEIISPYASFLQIDLTSNSLANFDKNFTSVSCLHAIEHMGLGRYGDPIDAIGHYKAINNLSTLLVPNGLLYLSHPTSMSSRIEYNAHRVISLNEMSSIFNQVGLEIESLSIVNDHGALIPDIEPTLIDYNSNYALQYGCAIWTLRKKPTNILNITMSTAFNWIANELMALPAPHAIKQAVLIKHNIYNCTWVETGTYHGATTAILANICSKVVSIEPSKELFTEAARKLKGYNNICLINKASEEYLPELLEKLSGNICFWLDGHFSGGETFRGSQDTPILHELEIIKKHVSRFGNIAVLIDDISLCWTDTKNYPQLSTYVLWAEDLGLNWTIECDIFIAKTPSLAV